VYLFHYIIRLYSFTQYNLAFKVQSQTICDSDNIHYIFAKFKGEKYVFLFLLRINWNFTAFKR